MSGISTHTIDERALVLLVAETTNLRKLIATQLENKTSIELRVVNWSQLDSSRAELESQDWYRVIYLLQPHHLSPGTLPLNGFNRQSSLIFPMTTHVSGNQSWQEQVQKELLEYESFNKKIDLSSIIFYQDFVDIDSFPTKIFFEQLSRGILIDPLIELSLLDEASLADELGRQLLKPQSSPLLITGRNFVSKVFLQRAQGLYQQYHQVKLPIKQQAVKISPHPLLAKLSQSLCEIKLKTSADLIAEKIARALPKVNEKDEVKVKVGQTLAAPTKLDLVRGWNKRPTKQLKKDLTAKLSLRENPEVIKAPEVEDEGHSQPEEKLNSLFSAYRSQQRQEHIKNLTSQTKIGFRKLRNSRFLFSGGLLFSLIAVAILAYSSYFLFNISRSRQQLITYFSSLTQTQAAQTESLEKLSNTVGLVSGQLSLVRELISGVIFTQPAQAIEIARLIVSIDAQAQQGQELTGLAYRQFFNHDEGEVMETLAELTNIVEAVFKNTSLLEAELKDFPQETLSPEEKQAIVEFERLLADQRHQLIQYQQLIPLFPELLAQDGRQTYALLLQNEQELRPTGGFIQAVALLTVEDGHLINIQVEDVYAFDEQLKGVLAPPDEVTQLLGEEQWFLRDANWNPDFEQTATRVAWFIDQSLGVKVNGVISINLNVLEAMMTDLGEVRLPEHNEVLTHRNLTERMEFHSEVQLVESNQRDYTELVLARVLEKIESLSAEEYAVLATTLLQQANRQELQIALVDSDKQPTLANLGWSGTLSSPSCPSVLSGSECFVDTIAQVEANIGVNKANYYLDRQIDHSIQLLENQVLHKRVVNYENKAKINAWPKGPYQAFTRFYLPTEVTDVRISIDEKPLTSEQFQIERTEQNQIVGVVTNTPVSTKTKLQLEYTLPHQQTSPLSYAFFDRKQPGAREVSPRVFLEHSPDYLPTLIAPQAEVQGQVIVFSPTRETGHTFVGATFE